MISGPEEGRAAKETTMVPAAGDPETTADAAVTLTADAAMAGIPEMTAATAVTPGTTADAAAAEIWKGDLLHSRLRAALADVKKKSDYGKGVLYQAGRPFKWVE